MAQKKTELIKKLHECTPEECKQIILFVTGIQNTNPAKYFSQLERAIEMYHKPKIAKDS